MDRVRVLASPGRRRGVAALAATGAVAASMLFGTTAFADPLPPAAPSDQVTANPIALARTQPVGSVVTVVGSATVQSGVFESSYYDKGFGLQNDNSGIYVSDPNNSGVALGDRVRVTGVLADQEGLLVIRPTSVTKLGNNKLIKPVRVQLNAVNESSEGRLVTVAGVVNGPVVDDLPYGNKVNVSGPDGNTVIFVNTQTGIDVSTIVPGNRITVTGFSGQYASTYEVLPRSVADVTLGNSGPGKPNNGS